MREVIGFESLRFANHLKTKVMLNYARLMKLEPFKYGSMMNDMGQQIDFYEHPLRGEEAEVIAVSHEMQLAEYTGFYELDDMTAEHGEYQPAFIDGELYIGEWKVD